MLVQPGAQHGQLTYCPVSGVVFRVQRSSGHRDLDGKTIYFCCESCANHFDDNRGRILAARNFLAAAPAEP